MGNQPRATRADDDDDEDSGRGFRRMFPRPRTVIVTDIRLPFWSMVFLMVKWALASIPAFVILAVLWSVVLSAIVGGIASGVTGTSR